MSLKRKIFEHLDAHGYVTDTDVAKMCGGKDPNWSTVEEYKRLYQNRQKNRRMV